MCSRYSVAVTQEEIFTAFDFGGDASDAFQFGPAYNIAPTHTVPVLTSTGWELMTWGITPWWDLPKKLLFITSENLFSKSTFQGLERIVMPLTGFFEWREAAGEKIPVHFSSPSQPILGFAGLRKGSECALLTTIPSEYVSQFHTRMPSLLLPEQSQNWILTGVPALATDPFNDLIGWDVTKKMSNPRFQGPECIKRDDWIEPQGSLF
jgi:putative SOS response-associated peptidase YedK